MKKILKLVLIALLIALVAGGVYLAANPAQASALWGRVVGRFPALAEVETFSDLWDMLDAKTMRRSEKQETTPARALKPAYAFPLTEEELELGIEWGRMDMERVYTYFKDIGGDLWLPFVMEQYQRDVAEIRVCGPEGMVGRLGKDAFAVDLQRGELRVSAGALSALPEGGYWLAARIEPAGGGGWYEGYYVSLYDQCAFHSTDTGLATGGNRDLLRFDRGGEAGFTFHLFNLGDNRVVDVWQLAEIHGMNLAAGLEEEPTRNFSRKRLKPGDFTVSPDGASVTLRPDYLNGLRTLYPYYFLFGLADHAMVDSSALGDGEGVGLVLTDGPLADPPYVKGPAAYSLSSGEDYVFTLHLGQALSVYTSEDGSGLWFGQDDGFEDGLGYPFYQADIREDETYAVPAQVLREAAQRGNTCFNVQAIFELSETYYEADSFLVEMR